MAKRHRTLKPLQLLLLAWLWGICNAHAEPPQLVILLSSDQPYYRQTADALLENIDDKIDVSHRLIAAADFAPQNHNNSAGLTVAIGTRATKKALKTCSSKPVLSIFIPKTTFENIIKSRNACDLKQRISAIYLDQPPSRFLDLAQQIKPNAETLGIVLGPVSKDRLPTIQRLAEQRGLTVNSAVISSRDNPIAVLRPLVAQSDLVLPLPDEGAINRAVAKWILNLSFQNKTPVIGFSRAYTEAGAVASVYSSPTDVGDHAGQLISNWLYNDDPSIWSPQFPDGFTLKTNIIVSRSLYLKLAPAETLKRRIKQAESQR